ncbi:MAG: hydantoinase/oxoprolinase family protein [Alphaproteobacteria bacterium]|nr:hydantoinase/oxoprolinase family protein [Alphaproteobacteria bacterium]
MQWIGVDVGGTFTDLVLYDEADGSLRVVKASSTPHDHSQGMMDGIAALGVDLGQVAKLAHGTTVATNTALERDGARMAVLTTRGHRDVLIVGRGNRTVLYNIKTARPDPLVPRRRIHEIGERMRQDGSVAEPLDAADLDAAVATLEAEGIEAVAVCYLHAYANPDHERRTRAAIEARLPGVFVSTSAEVLPEYREYERFATTALNAYVAPRVRRYLASLRGRLAERGYDRPVAIMASNGGTLPSEAIERLPVGSMLSGPAAGVIAATFVGRTVGFERVITYDMGGTSTDVSLIEGGAFAMTSDGAVGTLPNRMMQIDINSIGAGGGSIAAVGDGGFLAVGPRSAGAAPGPASYGRGGTEATVTDANVVLGRLGTDAPLGGSLRLDGAAARAAVDRVAGRLGLDPLVMADGIVKVAVARMTGAIKEISIMRGRDPRDFALFAYGGAGPLHAALVAEELGMRAVVVPPIPGNFSALGLLVADVRRDFVRTRVTVTRTMPTAAIAELLADLRAEAEADLAGAGFAADAMRFEARLDMRYVGQAFELSVPVALAPTDHEAIDAAFRRVYEDRYTHAPDDPTEIVNFRLSAYGIGRKPQLVPVDGAGRSLAAARIGTRAVAFDARPVEAAIYRRDALPVDEAFDGPAIVEESGSTTVVPPGYAARLERFGCLVLERKERS